jgi:hypothetical protein
MQLSLENKIQQLLDVEEIKRLKARYYRCVDTKQWDVFKELFTEDVKFEGEGHSSVGRDAFIAYASGGSETVSNRDVRTVHHGHMPEIEITARIRRGARGHLRTWSGCRRGRMTGDLSATVITMSSTHAPSRVGEYRKS